jgi:hypothetical protein
MSSEGRRLADKVAEHLAGGEPERASRALARGWRDAVPELPLRFAVILTGLDAKAIAAALRRSSNRGEPPRLRLRRVEGRIEVLTIRGARPLGRLPEREVRMLDELGADAHLYRPQLLEVEHDPEGALVRVAVELVRPEMRICSSCGRKHSGDHVNCERCRRRRRRKGEESFESSPLGFQEAVDQIVSSEGDSEIVRKIVEG